MKCSSEKNENTLCITISGSIDELADFSELDHGDCTQVIFDFKHLISFNSEGITIFVKFLGEITHKKIIYRNSTKIIIDQVNLIMELLPINITFDNVQIPYFCDWCDHEIIPYFKVDEFFDGKEVIIPQVKCDKCNRLAHFDEVPSQYFKFLRPLKTSKKN